MARPFIPAPNVARAQMIFSYNGSICENVLHYQSDIPYTTERMTDLAAALKGWWSDEFKSYFNVANSLQRIEVQALDEENSPGITYNDGLPLVGTNLTTENLPGNVTMAITLRTAYRGRSFRGRIYHLGLIPIQVTGNGISGVVAIAMDVSYDKLKHPTYGVFSHDLVVVSYRSHSEWRLQAVCTPVTNLVTHSRVDSQRRRLSGRGE